MCLAGKTAPNNAGGPSDTPYHAFYDIFNAMLVALAKRDESPWTNAASAPIPEHGDGPIQGEGEEAAAANHQFATSDEAEKLPDIVPWWLHGEQSADVTFNAAQALQSLPADIRPELALLDHIHPELDLQESDLTQPYDGKTRDIETQKLICKLLRLLMARRETKLCIMIDNMQWLDPSSAALIRYVNRKVPDIAWVFTRIFTPRRATGPQTVSPPESRFSTLLKRSPKTTEIRLGPLPEADAATLALSLAAEIGAEHYDEETLSFLSTKLPRNPAHIKQFVRFLFDTGEIQMDFTGVARAGPRLTEDDVSWIPTVESMIRRRFEEVDEEERPFLVLLNLFSERGFSASYAIDMLYRFEPDDDLRMELPVIYQLQKIYNLIKQGWLQYSLAEPVPKLIFAHRYVQTLCQELVSEAKEVQLEQNILDTLEGTQKKMALNWRVELLARNLAETTDEAFVVPRHLKQIKESAFLLSKHVVDHWAWADGADTDPDDLLNQRVKVRGRGVTPTTWTVLEQDGSNHLALWCRAHP